MRSVRKLLFGISERETSASRRGFPELDAAARPRLEEIGRTFVAGYSAALDDPDPSALDTRLGTVAVELRGFAYEGAAMSLSLLDSLTPWNRSRFDALLRGPGDAHAYMLHIGLGWAKARLRKRFASPPPCFDPLLGWLMFDGYGFHEGFFDWRRSFALRERPGRVTGHAARVFDQGLGRSSWFVFGARVDRIAETLASFDEDRRDDLWSGVGLAATYAGGVASAELAGLVRAAGPYRGALAQGAAFAAEARLRAGNLTDDTESACLLISGSSAREAARSTKEARESLAQDDDETAYEAWRRIVREGFESTQFEVAPELNRPPR